MQICKTCIFFKDLADKGPIDWGECRQNAPSPVTKAHAPEAQWPQVKAIDGCGKGIDRTWGPRIPGANAPDPILMKQVLGLSERAAALEGIAKHGVDVWDRITARIQKLEANQSQPWWKRLFARS